MCVARLAPMADSGDKAIQYNSYEEEPASNNKDPQTDLASVVYNHSADRQT